MRTLEERIEIAATAKAKYHCNCCQAVLRAYEDLLDVDPETLQIMGSGFGAGMGCMEGTCGALVGAGMSAGIIKNGSGTPRYTSRVLAGFKEKCGSTICKELKGIETGEVLCACPDCIKNAVISLSETLELE